MKTKLILGSLIALASVAQSQNIFNTGVGTNVGIGTTSPGYRLDMQLASTDATGGIKIKHNGTNSPHINFITSGTGAGNFMVGVCGSSQIEGNGRFVIHDANVSQTRFLIDPTGQIGMGTNTPGAKLDIYSSVTTGIGSADHYATISTVVQSNPVTGGGAYNFFYGTSGLANTLYSGQSEMVGIKGVGTNGQNNYGGIFNASGGATGVGQANYGVYAQATAGNDNSYGIYATASGGTSSNWAGYFAGNTYCTGSYLSSDKKLKNNIEQFNNALDKIMLLKPSTYTFKTQDFKEMNLPAGKQIGFIAQELEEVFPELIGNVSEVTKINEKGEKILVNPAFKSIQYVSLIPVLVSGIQEQQTQIQSQSKTNADLRAQLIDQQKQLDEQKQLINELRSSTTTGINTINNVETGFQMSQNEPNPFTHETLVKYTLPQSVSNAFMAVYDLTGKQITTFPISQKGNSALTITSEKLAAGIYLYSIVADGKVIDSKRMIVAGN